MSFSLPEPGLSLSQGQPLYTLDNLKNPLAFSVNSRKAKVKDFFTLLKPGVLALVIFTGLVGMVFAPGTKHPFIMGVNLLALAMASGGAATFNMWYDRDIDSVMERTRARPIPRGVIAPHDALTLAVILSAGSLLLMGLGGAWQAAMLLGFSIFFYSYIYTALLKRLTPQNIVIGGAAGALPPVIGWMTHSMEWAFLPWWMFSLIFLWTPSHFWALALLRKEDYRRVGIPMLPVTHGCKVTKHYIYIYGILLIVASFIPVFTGHLGWVYGVIAFMLAGGYLYYTHQLWRKGLSRDAGRLFGYSILYLFVLFSAMLIDKGWGSIGYG